MFFGNRGDHRPGHHRLRADPIAAQRPLRKLGPQSRNDAFAVARFHERRNARALIPGYYDDIAPLSPLEQSALDAMPANDADLQRELGIAKPDGSGKKLMQLLQEPSLNVRGIRSGNVGEQATNIVPDKAEASLEPGWSKAKTPRRNSNRSPLSFANRDFLSWTTKQRSTNAANTR